MTRSRALLVAATITAFACSSALAFNPIFIAGRSVSAAGDSLLAVTSSGTTGILVRKRGDTREFGAAELRSPRHIQWLAGEWFVSDVENGKASIAVFDNGGAFRRRVPLESVTKTPHQFAVLPDGRIVLESPEGALVALQGDSVSVFALSDKSPRPGIVLGAAGGVLHGVPDRNITLYNGFGHIRWRLEWPWASTAYVSEITVDAQGRIYVLAGVPGNGTFIVYLISNQTGEVLAWSAPGREPTFVSDRIGKIKEDKADNWLK